jgi:hypothetical protein
MLTRWPLPTLADVAPRPRDRFDPAGILRRLADAGVEFIVVGGIAEVLHGAPINTDDLDIAPSLDRANLERLGVALRSLRAAVVAEGEPRGLGIELTPEVICAVDVLRLQTELGRLDIVTAPVVEGLMTDRDDEYDMVDLDGLAVRLASLAWLIAARDVSPQFRQRRVPMLLALKDELDL